MAREEELLGSLFLHIQSSAWVLRLWKWWFYQAARWAPSSAQPLLPGFGRPAPKTTVATLVLIAGGAGKLLFSHFSQAQRLSCTVVQGVLCGLEEQECLEYESDPIWQVGV